MSEDKEIGMKFLHIGHFCSSEKTEVKEEVYVKNETKRSVKIERDITFQKMSSVRSKIDSKRAIHRTVTRVSKGKIRNASHIL